jgi:Ca2+-binding RTX toxin-like protein
MSAKVFRAIVLFCGILLVAILGNASASSNDVTASAVSQQTLSISANDLAPPACSSLILTNLVSGGGTLNGTAGNDLILGNAGSNTINANEGNDCVLGGDGDDTIDGGDGNDTCIGGPGLNSIINCE